MNVLVKGTWWQGDRLVIRASDDGREVWLPTEGHIDWDVGRLVLEPTSHPCAFEPKGLTDPDHHCSLCDKPTSVYMAFFGHHVKVGMAAGARLTTRWMEQGADAAFRIARFRDRATARQAEETIGALYHVSEYAPSKDVVGRLHRPLERDKIASLGEEWRARLSDRYEPAPLHFVEHPCIERPLPRPVAVVPVQGHHRGTILGAMGKLLFYEPDQVPLGEGRAIHAIRRSDLEGRLVTVGDG